MEYTADEFYRLMEAVEEQGGSHIDEVHDPVYHKKLTGDMIKGHEMTYCGEMAQFEIPYFGLDLKGKELPEQKLIVCAIDDRIGLWPRYASANAGGTE